MTQVSGPSNPLTLFDHNWQSSSQLTSEFETIVHLNQDGSEQRRGMRSKPRRTLRHSGLAVSADAMSAMREQLRRDGSVRQYKPLYCDESILTLDAPQNSTTLSCNTTQDKRFAIGNKAIVVKWDSDKLSRGEFFVAEISGVTSTSVTLDTPTDMAFSVGDSIYPAMLCEPVASRSSGLSNQRVASFEVVQEESVGDEALLLMQGIGTNPSGFSTYKGLPVFDMEHDWSSTQEGSVTDGRRVEIGLGPVHTLYGDSKDTGNLLFREPDRESSRKILRFFESRGGSLHPFWYPNRSEDLTLVLTQALSITVKGSHIEANTIRDHKAIAIWYRDGTVDIRMVTSALPLVGGDVKTIVCNLDAALTDTNAANIEKVSFASLARFSTDSLTESWRNGSVMDASLPIKGLCISSVSCTGTACECGNCEDSEDCDTPEDPTGPEDPGPPFEPRDTCFTEAVSVPMYYDLTDVGPECQGLEPIRAADLPLSNKYVMEIKDNWVFDPLHPFGQDISDELKEVLFQTHELEYVGLTSRTTSRNPYHTRVSGITRSFSVRSGGELVEDSPTWELEIPYKINEGQPEEEDHTLTLRAYAEWVDQSGASGSDSEYGCWGTMFLEWGFSTEAITYTDGTPYAPFDGHSFTEEDPLVGDYYLTGTTTKVKYAHPKALFVSMQPTSWHAPVGRTPYNPQTRDSLLEECFKRVSGYANGDFSSPTNAEKNNVFGTTIGGAKQRALGSLGGWTKSEFFNHACIENFAGNGMTILKPLSAGWDEINGSLSSGSAIRMDVCTVPHDGINPGDGHPDDPYHGKGGTHDGYRDSTTAGDLSRLVYKIGEKVSQRNIDRCATITTHVDGDCRITERECETVEVPTDSGDLYLAEYQYGDIGNSSAMRSIRWERNKDDPLYEEFNFPNAEECDSPDEINCWTQNFGSSSLAGQDATLNGFSGSDFVEVMMTLKKSGQPSIEDGNISATITSDGSQKVGMCCRASGISRISNGYAAVFDESAMTLTIYIVTGPDTFSVLSQAAVEGTLSGDYALSMTCSGSKISCSTTAGDGASFGVHDCTDTTGGDIGLLGFDSVVTYQNVSVSDNNWRKAGWWAKCVGKAVITSGVDTQVLRSYDMRQPGGTCEGSTPDGCPGALGPGPDCNGPCTNIAKSMLTTGGFDSSAYPLSNCDPANRPDWFSPIDVGNCDSPGCTGIPGELNCGSCPDHYYTNIELSMGGNYGFETEAWYNSPTHSPFIGGGSMTYFVEGFCP